MTLASPPPATQRPTLVFKVKSLIPASMIDALIISIAAILVSLVLFGLFVLCSGANPFDVFSVMYEGSFGTSYSISKTLIQAAPLMLTALCVVLPARVGMVIIGGEGCVLMGGLAAALMSQLMLPHLGVLTELSDQPGVKVWMISPTGGTALLVLTAMIIAGAVTGGLWTMISGSLRLFRGVNEVISSLLLSYIALKIVNHCVEGPMHDLRMLDTPSSFAVSGNPDHTQIMGKIPGTDIHWGLVYGLIACFLCYIFLNHTTFGFATSIVGGNIRAARIAGLSVVKYSLLACFIGGSAAGLAGVIEVAAVQGRANEAGLATGLGYTGILVAFVSRQNPLAVIPVAILLGGVIASGHNLKDHPELHVSDASVQVFQGILFLVILGLDTWAGRLHEARKAMLMPLLRLYYRAPKPAQGN